MTDNTNCNYDVAIVGMSARYPKSPDIHAFWENLKRGADCITREPDKNDQNYVAAYGKVDDIDRFDADFFRMNQREALITDPQQRFLMEGIYEALEDAGYDSLRYQGRIGLYTSCDEHLYVWNCIHQEQGSWYTNYQLSKIYADGTFNTQIAYKLNLQGPAVLFKYACASSLAAVHYAYQGLINFECDMAVTGGVSIEPEQEGYWCLDATASRSGYTRTFDESADGFVPGGGQGVIILKRAEDAIKDHDHIYAVIKSTNVNNDGNRKAGLPAPSVQGQEEAILDAMDLAEVTADDIDYFESHGTATVLGDSVELRALKSALRDRTSQDKVYIGSVKPNIGHTNVASGIANVIKVALMMHHGSLVPSIYFDKPNDELEGDDVPLKVADCVMPWPGKNKRATAGVSAFGLGGANAIAIMSRAPEKEASTTSASGDYVFVVSGKTQKALSDNCENLLKHVEKNAVNPEDMAYTLQVGRGEHQYRRSFVAGTAEGLAEALRRHRNGRRSSAGGKIVFVFSGAGSQGLSMGRGCYEKFAAFRDAADECFDIAEKALGESLRDDFLNYGGDESSLKENPRKGMVFTFILGYALAGLWKSFGVGPDLIMGHSLGEYIGACVAGVFSAEDAIGLIVRRAELFQKLPGGRMFNVAAGREDIEKLLVEGVSVGAVNGSRRVTLSGSSEDMEKMAAILEEKGIAYSQLGVNRAGHCDTVNTIREDFRRALEDVRFSAAETPLFSTYLAAPAEDGAMESCEYWLDQMSGPVLFYDSVEQLAKEDDICFVEIGASNQMSMLIRKSLDRNRRQYAFSSLAEVKKGGDVTSFLTAVGNVWETGRSIIWDELYESQPYRVSLPTYAFQRKSFWRYRKINHRGDSFELQDDIGAAQTAEAEKAAQNDWRNDMDKTVGMIFQEVLAIPHISIYEDLYELGFDSLSTLLISSRIEMITGEKISLNEMYSVTTIQEISDILSAKVSGKNVSDISRSHEKGETQTPVEERKSIDDLFEDL